MDRNAPPGWPGCTHPRAEHKPLAWHVVMELVGQEAAELLAVELGQVATQWWCPDCRCGGFGIGPSSSLVHDKTAAMGDCPHIIICEKCGCEVVPVSGDPYCTPCGVEIYGPIRWAVRAACDAWSDAWAGRHAPPGEPPESGRMHDN